MTASNSAFAERISATSHLLLIFKPSDSFLIFRTQKSNFASTSHVSFVELLPGHDLTRNFDGACSEFIHMAKAVDELGYSTQDKLWVQNLTDGIRYNVQRDSVVVCG